MSTADLRPKVLNLELYRGDAWSVRFAAKTKTGEPIDLTAYTIVGRIAGDVDGLDITPTDLPNGVIHFGQSAAGAAGRYDIQLTPLVGLPRTFLRGTILVTDDVTP